mgnify:CR=1 FL=1
MATEPDAERGASAVPGGPADEAETRAAPPEPSRRSEAEVADREGGPRGAAQRKESSPRKGHEVDPATLAQIGHLGLRARLLADSALSGLHRSRNHGTSVEFAEHKEYSPGDDVRHLDWRAFARFDRDFIKRFEDEASLRALLVVDRSGTMGYPTEAEGRLSKLESSKTAAAALAFVLARQGDAAGVASFAERLRVHVPPRARRGHLQEILTELERLEASGETRFDAAIDTLTEGLTRRSVVVFFTDLLDGGLAALPALGRLRARGHDVVLFHVLDADELDFPFEEATLFTSLESDAEMQVDGRDLRAAFLEEMARFRSEAEAGCRRVRVDYHLFRTDESPGVQLARFLASRTSARSTAR